MPDTDHDTTDHNTTESGHSDAERRVIDMLEHPAMQASDTIRAAVVVLEGVQEMRYAGRSSHLRECMRQTALAALGAARIDAEHAWQDAIDHQAES